MEYSDGESYEPLHAPKDGTRPSDAEVESRSQEAMRMLAAMHRQRPELIGLGDEPVITLTDEVGRWQKAFDSCELAPSTASLEARCRTGLVEGMPAPVAPAILHGDWRLGNMQCSGAHVNAVIDWEIWSLGDPRIDLAWMMLMADPAHPSARGQAAFIPAPDELLNWYSDAAGTSVENIVWAGALVRYKQAAASALLVKNAIKRGESGELVDRMAGGIDGLLAWSLEFLS
jgi:aminoglycoside phosphotransferase (APT) family kinase protein